MDEQQPLDEQLRDGYRKEPEREVRCVTCRRWVAREKTRPTHTGPQCADCSLTTGSLSADPVAAVAKSLAIADQRNEPYVCATVALGREDLRAVLADFASLKASLSKAIEERDAARGEVAELRQQREEWLRQDEAIKEALGSERYSKPKIPQCIADLVLRYRHTHEDLSRADRETAGLRKLLAERGSAEAATFEERARCVAHVVRTLPAGEWCSKLVAAIAGGG